MDYSQFFNALTAFVGLGPQQVSEVFWIVEPPTDEADQQKFCDFWLANFAEGHRFLPMNWRIFIAQKAPQCPNAEDYVSLRWMTDAMPTIDIGRSLCRPDGCIDATTLAKLLCRLDIAVNWMLPMQLPETLQVCLHYRGQRCVDFEVSTVDPACRPQLLLIYAYLPADFNLHEIVGQWPAGCVRSISYDMTDPIFLRRMLFFLRFTPNLADLSLELSAVNVDDFRLDSYLGHLFAVGLENHDADWDAIGELEVYVPTWNHLADIYEYHERIGCNNIHYVFAEPTVEGATEALEFLREKELRWTVHFGNYEAHELNNLLIPDIVQHIAVFHERQFEIALQKMRLLAI